MTGWRAADIRLPTSARSAPAVMAGKATGGLVIADVIRELDDMANTRSAKKAARQAARRTDINKARRSRIRTFVRRVEQAIATGDRAAAEEALRTAEPELMRGVHKGVLHKNTAARKVSRLAQRIKALGA